MSDLKKRDPVTKTDLDSLTLSRLNGFLFFLRTEKGLTVNTLTSYKTDLFDFFSYIRKTPCVVESEDLISYFNTLRELGLENNSIARRRSTLKSFFSFLVMEDEKIMVVPEDIPTITYRQQLPDVLSVDEMLHLLDSITLKDKLDFRNKAIMELMYPTGIRI